MARPKRNSDSDLVQTNIYLPRDLIARLKQAGGERGMGSEVRRRLAEWEFFHDAGYRIEVFPHVTGPVKSE